MPRNSTGQYSLPAGNPVADSTVISSTWANPTMGDLANEITQSLDRNGRGGMLVAFKNVDGTKAAPGMTFTTEPSSGIYRAATNDIRMSVGNDDATRWVDDNSQPVGSQRPFQIWDGGAFRDVLYEGGSLPQLLPDGTVSAPSLAFVSETTLGLYKKAAGVLGVAGNLDVTGALTAGTLTAGSGSVTDSSGAISFGNENLSTTGTLASGALTVTGATAINANVATPLTIVSTFDGIAYNDIFNISTGASAATYLGMVTQDLANSGTIRSGMYFDSSNHLNFINGQAGPAGIIIDNTNAVTMAGSLDVTGTTTGSGYLYLSSKTANQGLRLNNTTKIQSWNAANTSLRSLMQLDANEDIRVGSSANEIYLDNTTNVTGNIKISGNIFQGTNPATAGDIRMAATSTIRNRNAANTDNINMIATTASDEVSIAGSGQATVVGGNLSNSGTYISNGGTALATAVVINTPSSTLCPTLTMTRNGGGTTTNDLYRGANSAGTVFHVDSSGGIFGTYISSSGNLDVTGAIKQGTFSGLGATSGTSIQSGAMLNSVTSTAAVNQVVFYNPNGAVGLIQTNGSATSFISLSDPRTKSEFTPITGALDMILEARDQGIIGKFTFLSDPSQTVWGYNAHKLIDAQPNFGGSEGEGSRDAPLGDDVTPAGVDQSKRVPILEAAIGELLDRIKVLESV